MKLAHPRYLVTAEEVTNGKPDPEGYLMGRKRLGLQEDASVIVIEDAPSGIRAAKAAGCSVIGLTTTHTVAQVRNAGADWVVQDLRSVKILACQQRIEIEIANALASNT